MLLLKSYFMCLRPSHAASSCLFCYISPMHNHLTFYFALPSHAQASFWFCHTHPMQNLFVLCYIPHMHNLFLHHPMHNLMFLWLCYTPFHEYSSFTLLATLPCIIFFFYVVTPLPKGKFLVPLLCLHTSFFVVFC